MIVNIFEFLFVFLLFLQ